MRKASEEADSTPANTTKDFTDQEEKSVAFVVCMYRGGGGESGEKRCLSVQSKRDDERI